MYDIYTKPQNTIKLWSLKKYDLICQNIYFPLCLYIFITFSWLTGSFISLRGCFTVLGLFDPRRFSGISAMLDIVSSVFCVIDSITLPGIAAISSIVSVVFFCTEVATFPGT
jgi:hypothetical protein